MPATECDDFGPLDGVQILDQAPLPPGQSATQILGQLVADVVGLEAKVKHDIWHLSSNFVGKESVYFLSSNANKKRFQIDYRTPDGLSLLRKPIAECDVALPLDNAEIDLVEKAGAITRRKSSTTVSAA